MKRSPGSVFAISNSLALRCYELVTQSSKAALNPPRTEGTWNLHLAVICHWWGPVMDEVLLAPTATVGDLADPEGVSTRTSWERMCPCRGWPARSRPAALHAFLRARAPGQGPRRRHRARDRRQQADGPDRGGINWRLGPRAQEDQQTGEWVYARNDIGRGSPGPPGPGRLG